MKAILFRNLLLLLSGVLLMALGSVSGGVTQAQGGYNGYIWQLAWVSQNTSPSANEQGVRAELEAEIQKVLDRCCVGQSTPNHLGPYYVGQGYLYEDLYWLNPGETILVLAEALEFLPPAQRDEVMRYLRFEMQSSAFNPLAYLIEPDVPSSLVAGDSYRSFAPPLPAELARPAISETLAPPPENLYAAWAFAHYVSQFENPAQSPSAWQIIDANWSNIEALYNQIPATPRTYWQVMGAIGYARMARQLGRPYAGAEQRALAGLTAGLDYTQFYYNMGTDVGCFGNSGDLSGWEGVWDYCAFSAGDPQQVLYDTKNNHQGYAGEYLVSRPSMFAAEIGRFLHDNAQPAVMTHLNRYMEPSGEAYFPFWWENKGTKPWAVRDENTSPPGNGENAIMHPSFAWQLFMLRATVFPNETGDSMLQFLDTPWAIGDIFHLQKLVALLRLYSTVEWAEENPNPTTPTPTTSATPSQTPTSTSTSTPTATSTSTATPTPTQTITPCPTPTLARTGTATQTSTPTATAAPTSTPSQTSTPTATAAPTSTPSQTSTPAGTPSQTPTSTQTLTPTPTEGLALSASLRYCKLVTPVIAALGETITYTLSISHQGAAMTSTTWITDTLPGQLNFVSGSLTASFGSVTHQNGKVYWSDVSAPAAQITITYQMTVPTSSTMPVTNVATFYNSVLDEAPVSRSALVLINGRRLYLPLILKE